MRRAAAVLLAGLLAAGAAVPAPADAGRGKARCAKRAACTGKLARRARVGLPARWKLRRDTTRPAPSTPPRRDAAPGGSEPAPGGDGAPGPPPPPPAPTDDPRYLMVTAFDADAEWYLVPSRPSVATGSVSVEFNNRYAADPHNLRIERGGTVFDFPTLDKEQALERQFSFSAGTWTLWCTLPGHKAKGMVATIVAG